MIMTSEMRSSARFSHSEINGWIARALEKDHDAQHQLYTTMAPQAYRIAKSIVGAEDAEDVVQDFFVNLFAKLDRFRFESSFETWAYRMAVNQSLQHIRKSARQRLRVRQYGEQATDVAWSDTSARENVAAVQSALGQLPREQQALLQMKEIEGMDYHKIASILGIPEGTVGSRLNKARRDLKNVLERSGFINER